MGREEFFYTLQNVLKRKIEKKKSVCFGEELVCVVCVEKLGEEEG